MKERLLFRLLVKTAAMLAICAGLYAFLGFWGLPLILKSQLSSRLTQALHRPVAVGDIHINPFALTLSVKGFVMKGPGGAEPFVSVNSLFVNIELASSVWHKGLVVREMDIKGPSVYLTKLAPDKWNFSDLATGEDNPREADSRPFIFCIRCFRLEEGVLVFDNKPLGVAHRLTGLSLNCPRLSNLPIHAEDWTLARLSGEVDGAAAAITAQARPFAENLEVAADIRLDGASLSHYMAYIPEGTTRVRVSGAFLEATSRLHYATTTKGKSLTVQGELTLRETVVTDGAGNRLLALPELMMTVEPSRPLESRLHLGCVTLKAPVLAAARTPTGEMNLVSLGPAPAKSAPKETSPKKSPPREAFQLSVDECRVEKGGIQWMDHGVAGQPPVDIHLDPLELVVRDFSLVPDGAFRYEINTRVNQAAAMVASGKATLSPFAILIDFSVDDVHLSWLHSYLPSVVKAQLGNGRFSAKGEAGFGLSADKGMQLELNGRLGVAAPPMEGVEAAAASLPASGDEDRASGKTQVTPFGFTLDDLHVSLRDFSQKPGNIARYDLRGTYNQEASLQASGRFGLSPLSLDTAFAVDNLHLDGFAAILPAQVQARLKGGRFFAKGELNLDQSAQGGVNGAFKGRLALNDPLSGDAAGQTPDDDKAARLGPVADPAMIVLDDLSVALKGFSPNPDPPANFSVAATVNRKAGILVQGAFRPAPLLMEGDFTITDLPLAWAQPHLPTNVLLTLKDGRLGGKGNLRVRRTPENQTAATVKAEVSVDALAVEGPEPGTPFAAWDHLALEGLTVATSPLAVHADRLLLEKPVFDFTVFADKTSTITRILSPPASGASDAAAVQPSAPEAPQTQPPAFSLGALVVQQGDFQFTDKTINPDFNTQLHLEKLMVTGLTTRDFKSAGIIAEGAIDNDAPINITGVVNPLKDQLFVELTGKVSNMELSPFSPYAGKYIGNDIDKGKLTSAIQLKLEGNRLKSKNQVVIDQLTLGRKVASPDALNLPVGLAISLLKDRSGKIELNLPVSGRTDDPKFGIFKPVLNAVKQLILKAAASPFDLLGDLVGKKEGLQFVEFAPGSAAIDDKGADKLKAVAVLMRERPGVKLDVTGYADVKKDREALAEAQVQAEVKAVQATLLGKLGLRKVDGDPSRIEIPDADLRRLAVERARQVKSFLVKDNRSSADRVFLNTAPSLSPKKHSFISPARVELGVK